LNRRGAETDRGKGPPQSRHESRQKVSYGFLIQVLDALKEAGVKGNLSAFTEKK